MTCEDDDSGDGDGDGNDDGADDGDDDDDDDDDDDGDDDDDDDDDDADDDDNDDCETILIVAALIIPSGPSPLPLAAQSTPLTSSPSISPSYSLK